MDDNKDFEINGEEKQNAENGSTELNAELEKIAQTFREELKKAREEAEKQEESSEDTEQAVEEACEESFDNEPCEELCKYCGEKAADENGDYCEECRQALQKRPFAFSSIVAVAVVLVTAILSVFSFFDFSEGYAKTVAAKSLESEKKLSSALVAYDEAIAFFEDNRLSPKRLYVESARIISKTMDNGSVSMDDIVDRIGKCLDDSNAGLPMYRNAVKLREDTLSLYGTMQEFYSIMNTEYTDAYEGGEESYKKLIAEVEALSGTTVTITDVDGESTKEIPVDESMVKFCQYMLAYTMGYSEDAEKYITASYELNPEYLWLHAYEVAANKIKSGDLAGGREIAGMLLENNIEDADGYCLYSYAARMTGDAPKATEWADKGVELCPGNAELLRYRAMAYIMAGDYETAKECTDEAMEYEQYVLLYYVAIIAENELGNTQTVNELVSAIENEGIELSEVMRNYLDGSVTATEIFTRGSGDVE